VLALLVGAGVRCVVVELSGLWFIASDGLAVLLEARDALASRRRSQAVACPQGIVARALDMIGAGGRIADCPRVAKAAAGYRGDCRRRAWG
jgi:anti-anti-sigma factor